MKYEIYYDMDNTIVEMSKHLVNIYSGRVRTYGAVKDITIDDIMSKLHTKGTFARFKPIYRVQQTLRKLVKKGYSINVISQPMINKYCVPEKNYTLQKYFPMISLKNVSYTFQKYLMAKENRILIDDHIDHLIKWSENGGIAVCFERGYNKNWKGLKIKKHSEIFQILQQLEGKG